jgi:hypothetical protein
MLSQVQPNDRMEIDDQFHNWIENTDISLQEPGMLYPYKPMIT